MQLHDVVAERRDPGFMDASARHLRAQQIDVVAERAPFVVLAHFAIAACLISALWPRHDLRPGLAMFAIVLTLTGLAALGMAASRRRVPSPGSVARVAVPRAVALVGVATAIWTVAAFTFINEAGPDDREVVICALHGVLASSVLLAPSPALAWLLAIPPALGIGAALGPLGVRPSSFHPAVLAATFLVVMQAIRFGAREFARRVVNGYAAADGRNIISMLLRDFEASASEVLWQTGPDLRFSRVSRRLATLLAHPEDALAGASLVTWLGGACALSASGPRELLEAVRSGIAFRDVAVPIEADGGTRILAFTGTPIVGADGSFGGYRGVASDVTAATHAEARITHLARHDALTGIANRAAFREQLALACDAGAPFCLMLLDLDGFKPVNDVFGHQAGDAVLAEMATRIRAALPGLGIPVWVRAASDRVSREAAPSDGIDTRGAAGSRIATPSVAIDGIACRIGGDEFAVLCPFDDRGRARSLADTLIASLARPVAFDGKTLAVGVSVGFAFPTDTGWNADALVRGADLALYQAKARGRGVAVLFEPEFAVDADRAQRLGAELRGAVLAGALELDFQPVVDLLTGEVVSAEALVRWPHPTLGRIQPADFIPLAEKTGLIVPLGAWVLRRACLDAASWVGGARVAVNVSASQFRDPGFLATIEAALDEAGLAPERLELEITESVFLEAIEPTLACLHALRRLGVRIALDDFGTGYSALSYLRSFPFDRMKIDRAFVHDLGTSRNATAIVQAIVGLASSLGISTTGEGVETTSQVELLQSSGCSHVQGFLFGRPCSPDTIARIMRAGSGSAPHAPSFRQQDALAAVSS